MTTRFTIASVATLRWLEQQATTDLMEEAGAALWAFLRHKAPQAQHWLFHLGSGNNAGDACVLMRLAQASGIVCTEVTLKGERGTLKASDPWPKVDLMIDALFGIGLDRPLGPEWIAWIEAINATPTPVCSVDLPSGLQADTGKPWPVAVRATWTPTFMACTPGLATGWGRGQAGEVVPLPLKVPDNPEPLAHWHDTLGPLPQRPGDAHKQQCGHVLVVGGAPGHTGAALLSGMAALRAGSGLVSLLLPEPGLPLVPQAPELMVHTQGWADEPTLWGQANVVVIGPGLNPQTAWGKTQMLRALNSTQPVIWDAGALHGLAAQARHKKITLNQAVLTPHPGEAAVLLDTHTIPHHADRFAMVQALYEKYQVPVLLKGAGSLVMGAQGLSVCAKGHSGMATAGMGDVLSGVVASLWGQGASAEEALREGVFLHAQAADHAHHNAPWGMVASDVLPWIQQCRNTRP